MNFHTFTFTGNILIREHFTGQVSITFTNSEILRKSKAGLQLELEVMTSYDVVITSWLPNGGHLACGTACPVTP